MYVNAAVTKVQAETGMGFLQASRHVAQREQLLAQPNRRTLGSNCYIDHDTEYAAWAKRHPELAAQHAK